MKIHRSSEQSTELLSSVIQRQLVIRHPYETIQTELNARDIMKNEVFPKKIHIIDRFN